jgi:hypothetical protein
MSSDARLAQAAPSVESIRATTKTVMRAWLDGQVSDQFTHAAIERAYELSEQTRSTLTSSPELLADSRAVAMTQHCEELSRVLARLGADVEHGDRAAAEVEGPHLP